MEKIKEAIRLVFEEFDPQKFSLQMKMAEIGGWDSMKSTNLVLELEGALGLDLADVDLAAEMTVEDLAALLRTKGAAL